MAEALDICGSARCKGIYSLPELVTEATLTACPPRSTRGTDHVDLKPFGLADYAELQTHGFNDGLGNSYFALGPTGTDYLYFVGHELADLSAGDFILS